MVANIHRSLEIRFIYWQIIQKNEREEPIIILADAIVKAIIKIPSYKIIQQWCIKKIETMLNDKEKQAYNN